MGHREALIGRCGGVGNDAGLPLAVLGIGSDVGLPLACVGRDGATGADLGAEVFVGPALRGDVGGAGMGSASGMGSATGMGSLTGVGSATGMGSLTGVGSATVVVGTGSLGRWVVATSAARCRAVPLVVAPVGIGLGR